MSTHLVKTPRRLTRKNRPYRKWDIFIPITVAERIRLDRTRRFALAFMQANTKFFSAAVENDSLVIHDEDGAPLSKEDALDLLNGSPEPEPEVDSVTFSPDGGAFEADVDDTYSFTVSVVGTGFGDLRLTIGLPDPIVLDMSQGESSSVEYEATYSEGTWSIKLLSGVVSELAGNGETTLTATALDPGASPILSATADFTLTLAS